MWTARIGQPWLRQPTTRSGPRRGPPVWSFAQSRWPSPSLAPSRGTGAGVVDAAVVVVLGWTFLQMFYRVVETQWPHSYYSVGSSLDRRISSSPARYALFRFGPTYLVCAFAAVTLERLGHPVVLPVVAIGALHAVSTSGRGAITLLRRRRERRRSSPVALLVHVLITVGLVAGAVGGAMTAREVESAVPPPSELSAALWTALVAGVAGAFLIRATRHDEGGFYEAFEASRRAIGAELWAQAEHSARTYRAEPHLVQAFLLVENLQRPKWVRKLERTANRVAGDVSTGPLQSRDGGHLPDVDELDLAVRNHFAGRQVPTDPRRFSLFDESWLRLLAESYNPSSSYADDVVAAYHWLVSGFRRSSGVIAATRDVAADRLPLIEVSTFNPDGNGLRIHGTAVPEDEALAVRYLDEAGQCLKSVQLLVDVEHDQRGPFSGLLEPADGTVTIELGGAAPLPPIEQLLGATPDPWRRSLRLPVPIGYRASDI